MASAAREAHYRQTAVDGSLARDLDWELRERELRHAGEMPRRQQREAQKVHAAPKVRVRQRQRVSLFTLVGFSAVIALSVLVLLGYAQLTVLSSQTVALKNELSTLETENVTLTAQYEQMFDLGTVREAAEAAGMTKPSSSQVCHLDISDGDSAVVYQQEEPGVLDRILASLSHGVYAVLEYFD
jgi:cell division protein FtsB